MIFHARMLLTVLIAAVLVLPSGARELTATPETGKEPNSSLERGSFVESAGSPLLEDLFGRFLPRIGYSYDGLDTVGREGGLSAFQAFVPVWQDREASKLLFTDSRLLLFDARGTVGANLGLGGRLFSGLMGRTVGGYVYWDYSDTGRASFNQVSGGVETLGDLVDARANFYVPVGKDRKTIEDIFTPQMGPYFQNNFLLVGGGQGVRFLEQALCGFDTEAGLKFLAMDGLELRAFAGMYHYQGEAALQAWGPRGRLEARLRDTLAMGVSVQNDRLFGTTVNFNMLVTFGRLSGRSYSDGPSAPLSASDRLGDPVVRTQHVAVDRQTQTYVVPGKAVVDPTTGQPYFFLHVAGGGNSDGSFENPYATLAGAFADPRFAKGNVIVYDRTQGTYTGKVTFAPGTKLLSSGPTQELVTLEQGRLVLPFSGAGTSLPTVKGTITLASGSTISGFHLVGTGKGAVVSPEGTTIRDVVLTNNRFSGEGTGVRLYSVAGLLDLRDNQFLNMRGTAVQVGMQHDEIATLWIRNNHIQRTGGDGIFLEMNTRAGNTGDFVTVLEKNRIEQTAGHGIAVVAGGKSIVEVNVTGNSVREAGASGVSLSTQSDREAKIVANVRGNTIRDSGLLGDGAIELLNTSENGHSHLLATLASNVLQDNLSPGVTARVAGNNRVALELYENKALSPHSMFGFLLQQQAKGKFQAVGAETIGSRNIGSVLSVGQIESVRSAP